MTNPTHRAHAETLGRRTLAQDFRRLAELLQPGFSVLDVGCGTGAITAGIARAVGPLGRVVGIDRDPSHIDAARRDHAVEPNLAFELLDAAQLSFRAEFDIATCARMLQWLGDPGLVIRNIAAALKPGGRIVALDYIHTQNQWRPEPPAAFCAYYSAFQEWRAALGFDNEMGAHLPGLFRAAGLAEIESLVADETIDRAGADFPSRSRVWLEAIEATGDGIVEAGHLTEGQLTAAREAYARWIADEMMGQTLVLRAVSARVAQGAW